MTMLLIFAGHAQLALQTRIKLPIHLWMVQEKPWSRLHLTMQLLLEVKIG